MIHLRTKQLEKVLAVTREEHFLALLDEHKKILFKAGHLYCRNEGDFADLIQEMVLQAWRSFDRYDEARRFSTWLYKIALNVAISSYRGETRRSRILVPADESVLEIAAPGPETAALDEQLLLLRTCIAGLDDFDKALALLYLDGNSHTVIAEVLGISESNVGTRMHRIKRKLQRSWRELVRKGDGHEIR
jgi:RNA polymerase sigma-70 factor (ECF subfamily)